MLKRFLSVTFLFTLLAGCSSPTAAPTATLAPSSTATATALPPSATATQLPTGTPTAASTATPTATPVPAVRIPIIEYHDPEFKMNDQVQMSLDWFIDQMAWLSNNGFKTLSGEELVSYLDGEAVFPQNSVVLTFDVGTAKKQNYVDMVIPTLKKYGFKAIFFILSNDTVEIDPCKPDKRFCWDDFRQWAQEGLITIASHGLFHPDFTKISAFEIKYEVEQSKKLLSEKTGFDPIAFAYPFDANSQAAINAVKAAGYQFGVAGNTRKDLTVIPNDPDRFRLPRLYPYSNPRIYPALTGYNRPFGDVIMEIIRQPAPVVALSRTPTQAAKTAATPKPGQTLTATPTGETLTGIERFLQICRSLPPDANSRVLVLAKSTFDSDLSPEARKILPGLSASPSCNFFGNNKPDAIVLHYTVGDLASSMAAFRQNGGASAHYIIDRDGKVVQMVPESLGALHANCNGTRTNCLPSCPICDNQNGSLTEPYSRSVGIELVNKGHIPGPTAPGTYFEDYLRSFTNYTYWEEYTEAQIASLKVLVVDIAARWNIPVDAQHVLGHYRINYKVDPGPALNLFWSRAGNLPKAPIFP